MTNRRLAATFNEIFDTERFLRSSGDLPPTHLRAKTRSQCFARIEVTLPAIACGLVSPRAGVELEEIARSNLTEISYACPRTRASDAWLEPVSSTVLRRSHNFLNLRTSARVALDYSPRLSLREEGYQSGSNNSLLTCRTPQIHSAGGARA